MRKRLRISRGRGVGVGVGIGIGVCVYDVLEGEKGVDWRKWLLCCVAHILDSRLRLAFSVLIVETGLDMYTLNVSNITIRLSNTFSHYLLSSHKSRQRPPRNPIPHMHDESV